MKKMLVLLAAASSMTFAHAAPPLSGFDKLCEAPAEKKAIDQALEDAVDPENPPHVVTKFEPKVSGKSYLVSLESGGTYLVSTKISAVTKHIGDETVEDVCEAISAKEIK